MVIFDAALAGTTVGEWTEDDRFHNRPTLSLDTVSELVVIAAHPDDETLGAGGLIAQCEALGLPITVICVTDGAASHAGDPTLPSTRAAELERAVFELSPRASIERLGFPDGGTRERYSALRAELDERIHRLPRSALIAAPWAGDGHRDHRVVGELMRDLAGERVLLEYPVWMWHWASPEHPDTPWPRMKTLHIDVVSKIRAQNHYRSQLGGDSPILLPEFLEHFRHAQEFYVVSERPLRSSHFDALYARSDDPWHFRTRWYEKRKRDLTVASLPREGFEHALEIGCSLGLLTGMLAERCDHLVAVDVSAVAVAQARAHVGSDARIERLDVLTDFPTGSYDLIVLSEVGYYWDSESLDRVLANIRSSLAPNGVLLACHWRHPVAAYPLTGDGVHDAVAAMGLTRLSTHSEEDFLLEIFSLDPRSVARIEGLS
ncbi:methyltransferase domain-containing protein [Mycetocola tolaasinivorans]|uniref:Methyltransferase domain-containing protein n=1 Tax=Mycetocola tolaasinivorans TaxID=76635 RepID=A0A3L7AC37_9MICO|nr:bifunctional PIG-L family deacetylase/class I SAM-dependent methyltransferase [Mycetocola tolaasinivorans]RLP78056.1 methyltransferase domain-containing protein [Mycetocola tolaasinivorans]